MSLKSQPLRSIPATTKALIGRMLDEGTVCRFAGDVRFDRFHDEDFADRYAHTGRRPLGERGKIEHCFRVQHAAYRGIVPYSHGIFIGRSLPCPRVNVQHHYRCAPSHPI
jgi:hypothetical protein